MAIGIGIGESRREAGIRISTSPFQIEHMLRDRNEGLFRVGVRPSRTRSKPLIPSTAIQ